MFCNIRGLSEHVATLCGIYLCIQYSGINDYVSRPPSLTSSKSYDLGRGHYKSDNGGCGSKCERCWERTLFKRPTSPKQCRTIHTRGTKQCQPVRQVGNRRAVANSSPEITGQQATRSGKTKQCQPCSTLATASTWLQIIAQTDPVPDMKPFVALKNPHESARPFLVPRGVHQRDYGHCWSMAFPILLADH